MKLFRLVNELGTFYVIAENSDAASSYLEAQLNIADYGFSSRRKVTYWELIAEEIKDDFSNLKLNFSSGNNLIIIPKEKGGHND